MSIEGAFLMWLIIAVTVLAIIADVILAVILYATRNSKTER